MATSVGQWLLDEAGSGTTPTEAADNTGNGNNLDVDYSSGDAVWTNIASGNGVDFTATVATANTAILTLSDIANNGNIGSSFGSGTQQLSFIMVFDIDAGDASGPRLVQIGTDSGDGDFAIGTRGSDWLFRWSKESGGSDVTYPVPGGGYGTGLMVMAVVIDSTETTAADRIKVYYNNVLQTANSGTITLNESVDLDNSAYNFSLGNRESLNRNVDGKIYYAELFTGTLTTQEVSDAHTALISDNDSDWQGNTLVAESGSYVYTGTDAELQRGLIIAADSGTYTYSGTDADLQRGLVIPADSGSYVYTGTDATLTFSPSGSFTLDAESGSYAYSGTDAEMLYGRVIDAQSGAYIYSGTDASLLVGHVVAADSGSYVYSGSDATLTFGVMLSADSGSYSYSGSDVGLILSRVLIAQTGSYTYTGSSVALPFSGDVWTTQSDVSTTWSTQADSTTIWTVQ